MNGRIEPKTHHRFFRAMVLMGSSLAVGCGGQTITGESTSSSAGGSPGAAGSPGNGNVAGKGGAGGSSPSSGSSGSLQLGTGGSGGQPTVDPGPFVCPPAQWDCSPALTQCDYGTMNGWRLPTACNCDSARPSSASDCAPDQVFVCLEGTASADGQPLTRVVPFECSCAPKPTYCGLACDQAFKNTGGDFSCEQPTDPGARDILCGCALPLLR
jgi:hypothetical protein